MPDEGERKRGVLSPADREYLLAPDEYAENKHRQTVSERKEAIHRRVENALLDFRILLEELDPEKRAKIFSATEPLTAEQVDGVDEPLPVDVVSDALAFLFLGVTDNTGGPERDDGGHHFPSFESAFRAGMARGYRERDLLLDDLVVELSSRKVPDLGAVHRLVKEGGPLSPSMAATVVASGAIDDEALRAFLAEQLDAPDE